jgi:(2Fe-2S) ferredoxin
MVRSPLAPGCHVFVCANRREEGSPLGAGCSEGGEAVYAAFKAEVARRRDFQRVWITKTFCLGICPKTGCTVAVYPRQAIFSEVKVEDVARLYETELIA